MEFREAQQPFDDDDPPMETLKEIRAGLARSLADAKAGRTVPAEVVVAELRAMIAAYEAGRGDGDTHR